MKRITTVIALMFMGSVSMAQSGESQVSSTNLATSLSSSAIKLSDVAINPNPVKGQNFSLEVQNLDKGKYSIYAYDNNGKKYLLKVLNTDGGSFTETVELPKEITTGTYILQVVSKTSRYSKKMIVE